MPTEQSVLHATEKKEQQSNKKSPPVRITIPAITVNAAIQQVGFTPQGAMDVPTNTIDAGWYKYGPSPGDIGSAVLVGHYDGENGDKGVFEKLHQLKTGDKIYVENSDGEMIAFVVRETRIYDPKADSSAVFNQTKGSHLNIITCHGDWDDAQNSFSKRLVVFTDAEEL